ncbi:hypothetical protein EVAR_32987_1 [Eumeta japonica]|uniref:Uncharacterized protein n=1 Tax=Eumeta variegata TaxID=151549 RepID=A0A4C1VRG8_EUMVA|nr:hypothetical protein EVAR_32987_1 [Eumeta japonica]
MENNPERFSVIARSRKQVARPHVSRARCDPPISARRSPSSRHLAPINAHTILGTLEPTIVCDLDLIVSPFSGKQSLAAASFVVAIRKAFFPSGYLFHKQFYLPNVTSTS